MTRTRPIPLTVMMTESERTEIGDYAQARGMKLSELVREYITKGKESDKGLLMDYLKDKQERYNTEGSPSL